MNLNGICTSYPTYAKAASTVILSLLINVIVSAQTETWEIEAWERIDTLRKRDLTVTLLSTTGDPIMGAEVEVELKRHEFDWGAVVHSQTINNSPHEEIYKELLLEYFNASGFENGLKPKQRGRASETNAKQLMPWFIENNFKMRGHALVWEGRSFMPEDELAIIDDNTLMPAEKEEQVMALARRHFDYSIPEYGDQIAVWDVVNEPIANNLIESLTDETSSFVEWFKLADQIREDRGYNFMLALNENQIVSANRPNSQTKPAQFKALTEDLINNGAPIEMLGFQARIRNGRLSPEVMYERLNLFNDLNLPIEATEFEVRDDNSGTGYVYNIPDIIEQTEETMIIYFSHPNVVGFWHWTFVERAGEPNNYALFKYNGDPNPSGEKWIELMEGEFNTHETVTTPFSGTSSVRGYKGEYEVTVSFQGETVTSNVTLDEDKELVINSPFEYVSVPLSVMDDLSEDIKVGVNYDQNYFKVFGSQEWSQLELYDLNGKLIRSYMKDVQYNISGIRAGIYIVSIRDNDKTELRRKLLVR